MKRMLMVVLMSCLGCGFAFAKEKEEATKTWNIPKEVKIGQMTLQMPLRQIDAVYLHDFIQPDDLVGVETKVLSIWEFTGTVGVIATGEFTPAAYTAMNLEASPKFLKEQFRVGLSFGYDFDIKKPRAGIRILMGL